jgi:ribosomal protein S12 methylthiotransferase
LILKILLKEAADAVASGALELNVIAQDIAVYRWGNTKLPELVNRISEISDLMWIRLLYCHPDHITDDIIDLIASNSKVVPYMIFLFNMSVKKFSCYGREGDSTKYLDLISRLGIGFLV